MSVRWLHAPLTRAALLALLAVRGVATAEFPAEIAAPGIPRDYRQAASAGAVSYWLRTPGGARAAQGAAAWRRTDAIDGRNVRINDPSLDVPEATTQSETTLAVLGSTVCAGYVDTAAGGSSGISRSEDGGRTWADRGSVTFGTDPVLALHRASGVFFLAKLALAPPTSTGIGVFPSTDDCRTFPFFSVASPSGSGPGHLQDKPWIAVDNTGGERDGAVYVCWTRFVDNYPGPPTRGEIRFSASTDGGDTFTGDKTVSTPGDHFPFGCHIAVGPRGEVYVTWADRGLDFPVRFRRSADGGDTWDPPAQVNHAPIRQPGSDRFRECEAGVLRPTLNGDIRMLPQTWMAVDTTGGPHTGNIYVAWANDPHGGEDDSDVFVGRSADGGTEWESEMKLGDGTLTDQFEPFVAVGGLGTVAVAWFDRRNDPEENYMIDVYTALSRNGGKSFDTPARLTDTSFPVPPITEQPSASGNFDPNRSACYMGEYLAVAADDSAFLYAWGDNRNTVVSPAYTLGRPDPDVYFARVDIPGVCGDGVVGLDEQCDDANARGGDGCTDSCVLLGDANCDGYPTAADFPALTTLIADGGRAPCLLEDGNENGTPDAGDLGSLGHVLFVPKLPASPPTGASQYQARGAPAYPKAG